MTARLPKLGRSTQWAASAGLAILAAAAVFVLVNYLGARHYKRWDWTSSGLYSLSEKSRQILAEAAKRKEPIQVTAVLAQGSQEQEMVRELLENYRGACPVMTIEYLDPAANPLKAEALVKRLGLQSDKVVVFESAGRSKQVDITEFLDYDFSAAGMGGPPRIRGFKGEQAFTGAVLSVTEPTQTTVCFSTGHEELSWQRTDEQGLSRLADFLKSGNYKLEDWDSLGGAPVPASCAALVVAGPRRALLDSEAREIGAYLHRGGRLLALLDPELTRDGTILDSGLEGVLKNEGVELGRDLVVDRGDPTIILLGAGPETLVIRDLPSHPVTRNLSGTAAILPITRSVTPVAPAPAGVTVTSIARTSQDGWAERNLASLSTGIRKEADDLAGPVSVGVAVEAAAEAAPAAQAATGNSPAPAAAGAAGGASGAAAAAGNGSAQAANGAGTNGATGTADGAGAAAPKTRIVVFGDADFASNAALLRLGNLDLALNSVYWLTERPALLGMEPREPEQVVLSMTPEQARNLVLLVLLGLPAIAAVGGLSVWWQRRS